MAALKANYEFLFVGRDDNSFLENYAYDLFQDHGDKSGQVFINLEIQNNPVDAEEIAQVIFETMQKVFFEDVEKEAYGRFEIALKAVNGVLSQFKSQKTSGYIGNLNVIIAAIVGDDLLLTQCGDAEAYLIRKRYISVVSEGLSEEATGDEIFSTIANGKIEPGDTVLFSSTRLVRYIGKNDLAEAVNRKSIAEALADVRDVISTEILGRVGLTGISFEQATKEEVEAVVSGEDSITKSMLEGDEVGVSAKRESLTGKFLNIFKRDRTRKPERGHAIGGQGGSFGGGFREKVGGWFDGFWEGIFSKEFGKNKILALLIVVIVVLGVLVVYANSNRAEQQELQRLDQILTTVQNKIADAENKSAYDKEKAKDMLDKAYLDAKSVLDSGYYRDKATIYLLQIEDTRDKLDNVKRIDKPKVLADLTTKRPDVNALGLVVSGDRVFVYEYNALYELVLDQIQDPLTIDKAETVIAAAGFDDRKSLIFLTKTGKLIEFKDGTMSLMDSDDGAFRKGSALSTWGNKVYILDNAASQIWKYTYKGSSNKFGPSEGYVVDKTDISKASDFAIDSNVYVLQNNGDILKFYGGTNAKFYINNPPFNAFKDPKVIYTTEKLDHVYVLDAKDSRILVFQKDSKTGNLIYVTQYLFENSDELRDLYVNPDSKKMYVLTKSRVLEVDL